MSSPILQDVPPFTPDQIARYKADFLRDGFLPIRNILAPQEIDALTAGIDRVLDDDRWKDTDNRYGEWIAVRLFETDPVFEDMLTREPIIGLVESILGDDCHLIAENAVRNAPGL